MGNKYSPCELNNLDETIVANRIDQFERPEEEKKVFAVMKKSMKRKVMNFAGFHRN